MKNLKKFSLFENEESYSFEDLSPEAKENAKDEVRQRMWNGDFGADDIASWVIDDDYIFEPTDEEMTKVFGPNYDEDLKGNPMIANDRKNISYIAKDDQNYYLHCADALNVTNEEMFLGWLGFPPYYWNDTIYYRFKDEGTYTKLNAEIDSPDDLDPEQEDDINSYIEKAEKKFQDHMSNVLTRITRDIEYRYDNPEDTIESHDIKFDIDGNIIE